jgi:hypothetical protein
MLLSASDVIAALTKYQRIDGRKEQANVLQGGRGTKIIARR